MNSKIRSCLTRLPLVSFCCSRMLLKPINSCSCLSVAGDQNLHVISFRHDNVHISYLHEKNSYFLVCRGPSMFASSPSSVHDFPDSNSVASPPSVFVPDSSSAASYPDNSRAASYPDSSRAASYPDSSHGASYPDSCRADSYPDSSRAACYPDNGYASTSCPDNNRAASPPAAFVSDSAAVLVPCKLHTLSMNEEEEDTDGENVDGGGDGDEDEDGEVDGGGGEAGEPALLRLQSRQNKRQGHKKGSQSTHLRRLSKRHKLWSSLKDHREGYATVCVILEGSCWTVLLVTLGHGRGRLRHYLRIAHSNDK